MLASHGISYNGFANCALIQWHVQQEWELQEPPLRTFGLRVALTDTGDVRNKAYPDAEESFTLAEEEEQKLNSLLEAPLTVSDVDKIECI